MLDLGAPKEVIKENNVPLIHFTVLESGYRNIRFSKESLELINVKPLEDSIILARYNDEVIFLKDDVEVLASIQEELSEVKRIKLSKGNQSYNNKPDYLDIATNLSRRLDIDLGLDSTFNTAVWVVEANLLEKVITNVLVLRLYDEDHYSEELPKDMYGITGDPDPHIERVETIEEISQIFVEEVAVKEDQVISSNLEDLDESPF
jgi:hypothetical protein